MNFKEAKKHNKKLWDLYLKDEITKEEEEEGQIDLADLVSNQLESDEGLDKFYYLTGKNLNLLMKKARKNTGTVLVFCILGLTIITVENYQNI